jgi:hypothetical protein
MPKSSARNLGAPTPGEWTLQQVPGSYKTPFHILTGDKLMAICTGDQLSPNATSIGEAQVNAELIVRTVNSHTVLLAACESMRAILLADQGQREAPAADRLSAINAAKQAIAAKGTSK